MSAPAREPGPAELAELDGALQPLTGDPAPRADLSGRVMERVDALATHGWEAVLPGPGGTTRVAAGVVALVARRAVVGVDGVVAARAVVAPAPGGDHPRVLVAVRLTARAGVPLPALADRVRAAVGTAVAELAGVPAAGVDVHVDDLQV